MFLPFVCTAYRYYQLNGLVRCVDWNVKLCDWIEVTSDCLNLALNTLVRQLLHITVLQPFM